VSTRTAATTEPDPFSLRTGNRVALLIVLLLGCAGATLIALPHPTSNNPVAGPVPGVNPLPTPDGEAMATTGLAEVVALAEAYFAEHHTYEGITRSALLHYDVDSNLMPGMIYFATKERYCVETRPYGGGVWSRNGPLAPAQPHLCKRLELEASPAPHDGRPRDLPLLPRQAHVPGTIVKGPDSADSLNALPLERLAIQLNVYWINHRGTYTGAREHLIDGQFEAKIVKASGNSYCIVSRTGETTFVKKGPSAWIRSSSHRGPTACSQPAGPLIGPSYELYGTVVA
jgi:hypothetical protein